MSVMSINNFPIIMSMQQQQQPFAKPPCSSCAAAAAAFAATRAAATTDTAADISKTASVTSAVSASAAIVSHGDLIRIAMTPINNFGFRGYLRRFQQTSAIIDYRSNFIDATETTRWFVGDWQTRKGQPLRCGEPFHLIADDFQTCLLPASTAGGSGFVRYGNAWTADGQNRPQLVLRCDGVADGTPVQCNSDSAIYWLSFVVAGQQQPQLRFRLSQAGLYYLSAEVPIPANMPVACMLVARLQCDAPQASVAAAAAAAAAATTSTTITSAAAATTTAVVHASAHGGGTAALAPMQSIDMAKWQHIVLPRRMYLTIDDSCSPSTVQLMDIIDRYRIPAVFFINGSASSANFDALKRICQSANAIVGVHTWTHQNMASTLSVEQARQELINTINLIDRAHTAVGRPWQARQQQMLLFRAPFTDMGSGQRRLELEQMLQSLGFQEHRAMQSCMFGTPGSRQHSGLFLLDGNFGPDRTLDDYMQHVAEQLLMFRRDFPLMWDPLVFGTHDLCREPALVEWLHRRGVEFIDPRQTFASPRGDIEMPPGSSTSHDDDAATAETPQVAAAAGEDVPASIRAEMEREIMSMLK